MKLVLTIAFILLLPTLLVSQNNIGVKIDIGGSNIVTKYPSPTNHQLKSRFSGNIGFYINHFLNKKSSISAELLLIKLSGKDELKTQATNTLGDLLDNTNTVNVFRNITYLGIPLYYNHTLNKITLKVGVQFMYNIGSNGEVEGYINSEDHIGIVENKYDQLEIKKMDFGLKLGINYSLSQRIGLESNFYYGLNDIMKNDIPNWSWKNRQLALGINYLISGKK